MRRLITISLITIFMFWLIPLGVFIAPSKEKLLCDGQRAICMCSHPSSMGKKQEDMGKTLVKAVSPAQKESSTSAGSFFLAPKVQNNLQTLSVGFFSRHKSFYSLVVCKSIEHVPKS
jgi:hypothetical protein